MARRWFLLAVALAVVALVAPAAATVPVPPLTPAEKALPPDLRGPSTRVLPEPLGPFNYLRELDQIAAFLDAWQVHDAGSPDFGGMIEAESGDLGGVIQTDNTLEAIWVWSRYRELTGRTTYDANVAAAWVYCARYPAWLEEGSTGDDYYRVHNCAWALTAALQYEAATGDDGFAVHAATAANYIRTHALPLSGDTWTVRLRAFCKAWAAGNLYLYAEALGDETLRTAALAQGQSVLAWLNADPDARLGWEYWAMSAGTAVWGVCNSVLRDDPAAGAAWVAANGAWLDVWQDWYNVPGYDWDGAWNVAYANGHFAMGDLAPGPWHANGVLVTDALLSLDTDDDGGIKAETIDTDDEDMCWVTSYLAKFCLDRLIGAPAQDDAGVLRFVGLDDGDAFAVGEPIPVRILATNFGLADQAGVTVRLSGGWGEASWSRDLPFAAMDTVTAADAWVPPAAGLYTLTATTELPGDAVPANDAVTITLQVGDVTGVPAGGVVLVRPTLNPFGAATGLSLALPRPALVRLEVYDARGRGVVRLQDGLLDAGRRILAWDGRDATGRPAPAGVYLWRARVDGVEHAGKLVKTR